MKKTRINKTLLQLLFAISLVNGAGAQKKPSWRAATPAELQAALPARAPVEKERIETEMRTASGIVNSRGQLIAGVVLITAGYSADGKYSHYLTAQAPVTIGDVALAAGSYVFGWQRVEAGLLIRFYDATSGAPLGSATAHLLPSGTRVESFRLWPPEERPILQIGRFAVPYRIEE
jgi:hypothetical protein